MKERNNRSLPMSLDVISVAAANLAYEPPAIATHLIPDSPSTLDPSGTAGTSIATGIELATQLASETIPQLQIQADTGDQAAIAELESRANQKRLQPAELSQS